MTFMSKLLKDGCFRSSMHHSKNLNNIPCSVLVSRPNISQNITHNNIFLLRNGKMLLQKPGKHFSTKMKVCRGECSSHLAEYFILN
jgi:hypothetical protein